MTPTDREAGDCDLNDYNSFSDENRDAKDTEYYGHDNAYI